MTSYLPFWPVHREGTSLPIAHLPTISMRFEPYALHNRHTFMPHMCYTRHRDGVTNHSSTRARGGNLHVGCDCPTGDQPDPH